MRYLVAMIFAIAAAAATSVFLATPVATWVVNNLRFDSPDQVGDLHAAIFMGVNLVGMLIGWTIGWAAGGTLSRAEPED